MSGDLVLALPSLEHDFIVNTDASDHAYGAFLEQVVDDKSRIVAYYSKCYTTAQKNYATPEKELLAIVMAIEHWHTYLYGRKFVVYTDHQPLAWLLNKKNPHPRLERWLIRLAQYRFEIKYRKGIENVVADALSRLPNENQVNENINDDYFDTLVAMIEEDDSNDVNRFRERDASRNKSGENNGEIIAAEPSSELENAYNIYLSEQERDEDIMWIKELILINKDKRPKLNKIENPIRRCLYREYDNLRVLDGLVYRSTEDINGYNRMQYVLPKDMVEKVLDKIHTTIYSGHLGRRKTYRKIIERFYRPQLKEDVYKYVQTCDLCQKVKSSIKNKAELIPIIPTRTNQIVSTDFAGPFKTTVRGNRYLMIIVDCFGKYLVSIPLPDKETTTSARAILDHWFWTFGIPERVLSDRGKEFRSKLWDAMCELLDVERVNTTPWHPEGDGQSEKSVQQIKKMIRAHVDEDQENWDVGIAQLCHSYNTSVHETTGFTPFYIMFGRESVIPLDLMFPNRIDLARPARTETKTITRAELDPNIQVKDNLILNNIDILEDVTQEQREEKFPLIVKQFVNELETRMKYNFELLTKNKLTNMNRSKRNYDRKLKKPNYEIGDLVLCSHPRIARGLARGLAPKYHGPFEIVGKHSNKVDYLIKPLNKTKAHAKLIHINNLKTYYKRSIDENKAKESSSEHELQPAKRAYRKDPNNPRWRAKQPEEPESEPQETEEIEYDAEQSDASEEEPVKKPKKKRGRPKGSRNKPKPSN